MSFELRADESLRKSLHRIVRKQLGDALKELTEPRPGPRDVVVHDARKALKRVRAVVRLVRPVLGEKAFQRENTCFRDAARPLTEVRDARILVETLDKLTEHFKEHILGESFSDVRKSLQAQLREVRRRVLDQQNAFAVAAAPIRRERDGVKEWMNVPNRWRSVGLGLRETYRRAKESFKVAKADPTDERLHEWRKQSKYLFYQLEILRPLWTKRMDEMVQEADQVGQLLGEDHDLVVLRQMVNAGSEKVGDDGDRETLLALIDRRRDKVQQEALLLGERFFQDKVSDFARRFSGYWKTWRDQVQQVEALGQRLALFHDGDKKVSGTK
jgi:CHAD domain-containing protein